MDNLSDVLTNIATDFFSALSPIVTMLGLIAGCLISISTLFDWREIFEGRQDAMNPRHVVMKMVGAAALMTFSIFANSWNQTVGGTADPSSYATLALSGIDSDTQTQANAAFKAIFQLLQVMGTISEFCGVVLWTEIANRRSNNSLWDVSGWLVAGGCAVHMSLIVELADAELGTGFFS